jgi:hypothetical protein
MIFRERPTAASGGVDFNHNHNDIKFINADAKILIFVRKALQRGAHVEDDRPCRGTIATAQVCASRSILSSFRPRLLIIGLNP